MSRQEIADLVASLGDIVATLRKRRPRRQGRGVPTPRPCTCNLIHSTTKSEPKPQIGSCYGRRFVSRSDTNHSLTAHVPFHRTRAGVPATRIEAHLRTRPPPNQSGGQTRWIMYQGVSEGGIEPPFPAHLLGAGVHAWHGNRARPLGSRRRSAGVLTSPSFGPGTVLVESG